MELKCKVSKLHNWSYYYWQDCFNSNKTSKMFQFQEDALKYGLENKFIEKIPHYAEYDVVNADIH